MLIPLGILAGSVEDGSSYELISTANGTGSSGTITFSSIPQDYKHLQIRWTARNTLGSRGMTLRMNGATGSVYARHLIEGRTTFVETANATSQTSILLDDGTAENAQTNQVAAGIMDILDYSSSSKNTTVRALFGQIDSDSTPAKIILQSGLYNATTEVTSLSFITTANNFATVSRFSLYGIKG